MQVLKTAGHEGEPFYPHSLERGRRSVRALMLAVAEMYIKGVSTREAEAVMRDFGIESLSSTQVSRATKLVDEKLEAWHGSKMGRQKGPPSLLCPNTIAVACARPTLWSKVYKRTPAPHNQGQVFFRTRPRSSGWLKCCSRSTTVGRRHKGLYQRGMPGCMITLPRFSRQQVAYSFWKASIPPEETIKPLLLV